MSFITFLREGSRGSQFAPILRQNLSPKIEAEKSDLIFLDPPHVHRIIAGEASLSIDFSSYKKARETWSNFEKYSKWTLRGISGAGISLVLPGLLWLTVSHRPAIPLAATTVTVALSLLAIIKVKIRQMDAKLRVSQVLSPEEQEPLIGHFKTRGPEFREKVMQDGLEKFSEHCKGLGVTLEKQGADFFTQEEIENSYKKYAQSQSTKLKQDLETWNVFPNIPLLTNFICHHPSALRESACQLEAFLKEKKDKIPDQKQVEALYLSFAEEREATTKILIFILDSANPEDSFAKLFRNRLNNAATYFPQETMHFMVLTGVVQKFFEKISDDCNQAFNFEEIYQQQLSSQLASRRLADIFGTCDISTSDHTKYIDWVQQQIKQIPDTFDYKKQALTFVPPLYRHD